MGRAAAKSQALAQARPQSAFAGGPNASRRDDPPAGAAGAERAGGADSPARQLRSPTVSIRSKGGAVLSMLPAGGVEEEDGRSERNFREFMINQRAAAVYRESLHKMATGGKASLGRSRPSTAIGGAEDLEARIARNPLSKIQGLSSAFSRREAETFERRATMIRGARPTSAFGQKWQGGSVMTALLDPNHPHYHDSEMRKDRSALVGRGKVSTKKSMNAFLDRLHHMEDQKRERLEHVSRQQMWDVRYSRQLSKPVSRDRLLGFLERNDPAQTLEQKIRTDTEAERRVWEDIGWQVGGPKKKIDLRSEEHLAFLERQAVAWDNVQDRQLKAANKVKANSRY